MSLSFVNRRTKKLSSLLPPRANSDIRLRFVALPVQTVHPAFESKSRMSTLIADGSPGLDQIYRRRKSSRNTMVHRISKTCRYQPVFSYDLISC